MKDQSFYIKGLVLLILMLWKNVVSSGGPLAINRIVVVAFVFVRRSELTETNWFYKLYF